MTSKKFFKEQLSKQDESQDLFLFIQYSDYTVKEWNLVKRQILNSGFTIQVIKNTTIIKRLAGSFYEPLESSFHGPMAVITSSQEFSSDLLKDLFKTIKKESQLHLVCAVLDNKIIFPGTLKKWSELPTDHKLYLSLLGLVNKPIQNFISTSKGGGAKLCSGLDRYLKSGDQ